MVYLDSWCDFILLCDLCVCVSVYNNISIFQLYFHHEYQHKYQPPVGKKSQLYCTINGWNGFQGFLGVTASPPTSLGNVSRGNRGLPRWTNYSTIQVEVNYWIVHPDGVKRKLLFWGGCCVASGGQFELGVNSIVLYVKDWNPSKIDPFPRRFQLHCAPTAFHVPFSNLSKLAIQETYVS